MNKFLLPIYKSIFEESYSYADLSKRVKMQNLIYLLQNEGVGIGHYGFEWYKSGLYSQALSDDLCSEVGKCVDINYSESTLKCIDKFKKIFCEEEAKTGYGSRIWVDCLASIHFLKNKEMKSSASKDDILDMLKVRKPYMTDVALNEKAYMLVAC